MDFTETDDMIEVEGQVFHKPFVEKPVSAEDHNIYIYFPSDYGGGSQRLFRKVSIFEHVYDIVCCTYTHDMTCRYTIVATGTHFVCFNDCTRFVIAVVPLRLRVQ